MGAAPTLTAREIQVLEGMSHGRSNAEIGRELFLSEDTVKTHARRLFKKLGASTGRTPWRSGSAGAWSADRETAGRMLRAVPSATGGRGGRPRGLPSQAAPAAPAAPGHARRVPFASSSVPVPPYPVRTRGWAGHNRGTCRFARDAACLRCGAFSGMGPRGVFGRAGGGRSDESRRTRS